jgi:hypothetical protein
MGQQMTPEAAKARIHDEVRKETALTEARREAFAFANELEDAALKPNPANPAEPLETFAQKKQLPVQTTEPFSQFQGPQSLSLPAQFTKLAFQLTPEEPIVQEPVGGEDGFYVIAFKRRLPSEIQPLESIRAQVTQDFQRKETSDLARAAGTAFLQAFTNAPAASKNFDALAAQHGAVVVDLPPFARQSSSPIENLPPVINDSTVRRTAFDLAASHTSSYLPGPDGGSVLYVEKFVPASEDDMKQEIAQFTDELRRREASEAFNEWFGKQLQLAQLQLPGDKTEQMPE